MLRRYRLALALWICSVVMVFVAFVSASIVQRGIPTYEDGAYSTQAESLSLPLPLLILDSCILAASGLLLEVARRRTRAAMSVPETDARQSLPIWFYAGIALSLVFLVGQAMVWRWLRAQGESMRSGTRAAFFYLFSGAHALQIIAGLFVLAWMVVRQASWTAMRRHIAVDLATWYFNAMTLLWIFLFCFVVFV